MEGLSGVLWSSLLTRSWEGVFWISLYRQLSDSNKHDGIINRFSQVATPNNVYLLSFSRISSPNGGSIHSHVKLHPFSILGFIPGRSLSLVVFFELSPKRRAPSEPIQDTPEGLHIPSVLGKPQDPPGGAGDSTHLLPLLIRMDVRIKKADTFCEPSASLKFVQLGVWDWDTSIIKCSLLSYDLKFQIISSSVFFASQGCDRATSSWGIMWPYISSQ